MPVLARKLRHDCPDFLIGSAEGIVQRLHGRWIYWRAVDQCYRGSIATAVEHFVETDLQRTELTATRVRVNHQRCALRINERRQSRFVLPHDDDDKLCSQSK